MPGAYDGLSARIIEDQGFKAIVAGGYAAAGSLLGQPDTGQSNMRDSRRSLCAHLRSGVRPGLRRCRHGLWRVDNVRQTVRAFERAGVAGLFFTRIRSVPSRCGYLPGKSVIPVAQMLAKINRPSIRATIHPGSLRPHRCCFHRWRGRRDERCQLFMEAGVDMAKPQGIDSIESIARAMKGTPGPHFVTLSQAAGDNHASMEALAAVGVAAATFPLCRAFRCCAGRSRGSGYFGARWFPA